MWISPTAVCWTSAEGSILAGYVVELLVVLDTTRWRRGDSSAERTPCARHRALDLGELPNQGRGGQAVSLRGLSGHRMRIDQSDGEALRTVRRVLPREWR